MNFEPNRVKGIIPKLFGGLGNQMFIVSAAYCIAKILKCPFYLPQNPNNYKNEHNTGINYYETIFKDIGIHLNESEEVILQNLEGYEVFNRYGFTNWNVCMIHHGMVLDSYFQFYPTLEPFEEILQTLFLQNLPSVAVPENTAFLHIRRGDYLSKSDCHYIQPLSYYKEAIDILKNKNKINKIYVFSDDISWVKSEEFFQNDIFNTIDEKNELISLALMSQCKAGAICANSTFSWWGAFLGAHKERNPVIVPKKWIAMQVESLFPDEWIIL